MSEQLFSAADIADFVAFDASAMPSTCRVLRRTSSTSGGRNTPADTETVVATGACRLTSSAQQPTEGFAVGRAEDFTRGTVALDVTGGAPDVRPADRIEVTTGAMVLVFEVDGDPWMGSYGTNLTAPVTREG